MFKLNKKKLILISLIIVLVIAIGGILYYFQIKYGIFYSLETRKEMSTRFLEQAEVFIKQASFKESEKAARKAINYDPKNIKAYIALGKSLYAQQRFLEAKKDYLNGLKQNPENFEMNFYLANVLRDLKEFDLADKYYKKATEIEPGNIVLWASWAISYRDDRNDPNGAVKIYEEALKINPDNEQLQNLYKGAKKNAGLE